MKLWKLIVPGWVAWLVLAIALPVLAGVMYLWVTTVHLTVTDKEVVVYSDVACTANWTEHNLSLGHNQAWVGDVYVRNNGSENTTVKMVANADGFGFVLFVPSGNFTLEPNQVQPVEVTIYITPDAPLANYSFSIIATE